MISIRSKFGRSGVYTNHVSQSKSVKVTWSNFDQSDFDSVNRLLDLFHKSVIDNPRSVKMSISRVLFDLHIKKWVQKLYGSSKGKLYYCFKQDLTFQNYLSKFNSKHIIYPSSSLEPVTINYQSRRVDMKTFH